MSQPLIKTITRRQAFIFAIFLVMYEFLTYVANDMIMPGMIYVVKSFHAPESAIPTSLTAYVLGGASLQLLLGPLSDSLGRRPVMLAGALLFSIFTAMIANSYSIEHFLIVRFFQGMGLCFIGVVGYATLQEIFAEMDAVRLLAVMASVAILAPLIGPLLGAVLINIISWRTMFAGIALLALFVWLGLWLFMPEPVGQIKTDGEEIKRMPLALRPILGNYKKLIINPAYLTGTVVSGLVVLPCLLWIAFAPIILVTVGHKTIIEYGLWQIPLFGACLLGTWSVRFLSYHWSLKQMITNSVLFMGGSLLITFLLPWCLGEDFIWLIPGLILYFFGLGIIGSPLTRYILFITPVTKGTASALLSMITMVIQGVGIELGNWIYHGHNNIYFGLYCLIIGLTSVALMKLMFNVESFARVSRDVS